MAPPRQRTTAIQDDSRSEGSSTTREQKTTTAKGRKGNTLLAVGTASTRETKTTNVTSAPADGDKQDNQPKMHWPEMPLEILHSYRHAHKLSFPSAYNSEYSRLLLSKGIGLRSPTSIAARRAHSSDSDKGPKTNGSTKKTLQPGTSGLNGTSAKPSTSHRIDRKTALNQICSQDRVSKNQLAVTVRKHFNSAGLAEQEAIARFLYKVREEGRGRHFRLRFQP
ncbi:hypothetical protein P170DRAFT_447748 [Aspergillus steynii IBT 23096]|uniref:Histone deacetylase complex subunit SAP30 Sin3 binding domain-containing protein n=1 Tax=Aspergillus steynii IBT 23096 TaxID=1392250 RepID=A0A2I2G4V2_9EURO|nr:uncharacterized protein P170DRAFT_447748 [Aspergillus steynii IBT 23096]PLB47902.1 hypothetical protein P170DRAFT_447748 [Aspergillus steynii IBT 23096]